MKVFIKSLWGSKSASVSKSEIGVGRGIVAQINARTKDKMRDKVVFV